MYQSTHRHQSSFEALLNPSAGAVVRTVLAAAAAPLAVVAVLSHPVTGLAAAAFVAVAYRLLTTGRFGRLRRPFRRGLARVGGRSERIPAGDRANSSRCEDAA